MDKISENYCREVYLFDRKIVVLGGFFPINATCMKIHSQLRPMQ